MRISDLSSDVCSSDLHFALTGIARGGCWRLGTDILDEHHAGLSLLRPVLAGSNVSTIDLRLADDSELDMPLSASTGTTHAGSFQLQRDSAFAKLPALLLRGLRKLATGELRVPSSPSLRLKLTESRSEEHTSELQSLMRNSSSVFCLKKQTK